MVEILAPPLKLRRHAVATLRMTVWVVFFYSLIVLVDKKKLILIAVGVSVLLAGGVGFWFWPQKEAGTPKQAAPEEKTAVGTAKTIDDSVPKIQTNPGEKVPEINPLDRANPFKYTNPLR